MKKSLHDRISERLAKSEGVDYNRGKGPDVKGSNRTIEVAVHDSDLRSSVSQVSGFKKPYLATTRELIPKALELTQGTGIGVMSPAGKIVKRARGK